MAALVLGSFPAAPPGRVQRVCWGMLRRWLKGGVRRERLAVARPQAGPHK